MKGDYGIRALIDLGLHYGEGPVQSAEIAQRQFIPEPYLDQLLTTLRKAGFPEMQRGTVSTKVEGQLKDLQRAYGLPESGKLDTATLALLGRLGDEAGALDTFRRVRELVPQEPTGEVLPILLAGNDDRTRAERARHLVEERFHGARAILLAEGEPADERAMLAPTHAGQTLDGHAVVRGLHRGRTAERVAASQQLVGNAGERINVVAWIGFLVQQHLGTGIGRRQRAQRAGVETSSRGPIVSLA